MTKCPLLHGVNNPRQQHIVVVLGMHRSGTSAIARGLRVLGIDLGDNLMPVAPDNPRGYWEDLDINALNISLLKAVGHDWHTLTPVLPDELSMSVISEFKLRAVEILREKLNASGCFGLKDPRIARLLPFWQDVFAWLRIRASYVIACRNPMSVAHSLAKRDGFDLEKGYYLWLEYMLRSLTQTTDQTRIVVDYDHLMEDPAGQLSRIAQSLGLDFDPSGTEFAEYRTHFLENSLRHTHYRLDDLRVQRNIPPSVTALYKVLVELATDTARFDHPEVLSLVGHISEQFRESYAALCYMQACEERALVLAHQLTERQVEVAGLNEAVADRNEQLELILASRSWQLTKPLRLVGRVIRGDRPLVAQREQKIPSSNQGLRIERPRAQGLQSTTRPLVAEADAPCSLVDDQAARPAEGYDGIHMRYRIEATPGPHATQPPIGAPRRRPELAAHIDTPEKRRRRAGTVRFSGWCCHPKLRIATLALLFGDVRAECRYGVERPDVKEAYPEWVNSHLSGFDVTLKIPPAQDHVMLEALLENGQTRRFETSDTFHFVAPPMWHALKRGIAHAGHFTRYAMRAARDWQERNGRWPSLVELPQLTRQAIARYRLFSTDASHELRSPPGFVLPARRDPYDVWVELNHWNDRANAHLRDRLACCESHLPKVSVVMPVYNPPIEFLDKAIDSVLCQVYEDWELCIADDASTDPAVRRALEFWRAKDARIHVAFRADNGNISRATNTAAELASGEFLVLMDQDDELTPDALAEVALHVATYPDTDFLYSDDDKIDTRGHRFAPQFKPNWSPELLLSYMYCSHLVAVRRALFEVLGGIRTGFEGSQDYDFALRATERARRIGHIPLVLYHWRVLPGSTAASGDAKPSSIEAGRRAVQEAFERRGTGGTVVQADWAARGRLGIFPHEFLDDGPSVAILIPTKNQLSVLRRCVESLRRTTYRNYRVIIIDNDSDDPETLAYLDHCGHQVLHIGNPGPSFNFAFINNRAAEQVDTDYLLFLNNDTEVREPRWLSRMMGYAQITDVGAVGARLLFPDGRIQHAGIVHGLYHGMAGPAFKLAPAWDYGYLSYAMVVRNYSAVTAACLLTPRSLFLGMKGFDEENFAVAYNDADYCYRLVDAGHRCVYVPGAELTHHEGHSRGFADRPSEEAAFRLKYGRRMDAWYSPHLSLANERFEILPRHLVLGGIPPVRSLMVAFNLNLEGAPYSQYEMTVGLRDVGAIDPIIYSPQDGPLRRLYEEKGLEVYVRPHPLLGIFASRDYDKAIARFANFVKSTGADVVYGNTLQTFYTIAAAKVAGVPSIWNLRESEPWQTYFDHFGSQIAARALECFAYPYRVVFVADATRDMYAPLNSRHNFMVVHNGLDLERLAQESAAWTREGARVSLDVEPQEVSILLVGTVCPRKGQHDLPRALALLSAALHERIKVFIVGDRPSSYSRVLHELVAALPETLRARVEIVQEIEDVARYYRAADIFVCTSRVESYPRVILEAMAYGLPIVTTPVYGIREQVREDVNGLFYTPGYANELSSALDRLIHDESARRDLANNSRCVLALLTDFDTMVEQYACTLKEARLAAC
jgi:glycosyltransferase involved in cell wall biosynthesis